MTTASELLHEALEYLGDADFGAFGVPGPRGMCDALWQSSWGYECEVARQAEQYLALFAPTEDRRCYSYWLPLNVENIRYREMILLFAAAVAESEGR